MSAAIARSTTVPSDGEARPSCMAVEGAGSLAGLDRLAKLDIEATVISSLSGKLHSIFDPVSQDALPIYFGPLLGRLYLEGL